MIVVKLNHLNSFLYFNKIYNHWYASVLNKRFLTPFRDGIRNRRQVSVGDRGVLPTRPRNHWGYALLAHMLGTQKPLVPKII